MPMSGIPDVTPTSLAAPVEPRTGKIIQNGLRVFERGENLPQNGILYYIDFSERDFAPKRLMGDSIIILLMTVINDDV